jgi:hypothetical protein
MTGDPRPPSSRTTTRAVVRAGPIEDAERDGAARVEGAHAAFGDPRAPRDGGSVLGAARRAPDGGGPSSDSSPPDGVFETEKLTVRGRRADCPGLS